MAVFEGCLYAGDLLGWRAEIVARIQDTLARRAVLLELPLQRLAGARAFLERIAGAASLASLKRALGELLAYLRREAPASTACDEVEALHARIRAHGSRESIENYCAYLFTVPVTF